MKEQNKAMKQIEERCELSDIIDYAIRDWDGYIEECHEEGNAPIDTYEEYIADAVLGAGYRKQEWISVDERLPEEDGCYITYTNANGKSKGVIAQSLVTRTIRGIKVRRWEWQTKVSPWIVTHWMPLPEAPKMKGGE